MVHIDGQENLRWHVFGERTLYESPWVRLVKVDVEPPDGHRFEHHVVRLGHMAVTIVRDSSDSVLMMWRHRFATDEWGWELPGGIVDAGETAIETAAREVEEETGWRPVALEHVVSFQPMPGMVDTPHEVFLARGAELVGAPADAQEAAHIEWMPMADVRGLVARGEVLGSGSLVGLLYVLSDPARLGDR